MQKMTHGFILLTLLAAMLITFTACEGTEQSTGTSHADPAQDTATTAAASDAGAGHSAASTNPAAQALIRQAHQPSNDSLIQEAKSLIESGDLILRTGRDYASEFIRDLSREDKTYSHGGIAIVDSGQVYVYHIEPDNAHIHDRVRKEPLDTFCNVKGNQGFGVARYELSGKEKAIFLRYLATQYKKGIVFDMNFQLSTNDSMYCSEMIRKGLAQATQNKIIIRTDHMKDRNKLKVLRKFFKLPDQVITARDIIFIDQLYLNPYCKVLKRYQYFE